MAPNSKIYLVATCTDGRVMFILRPNIDLNKDYQTDDTIKTIIKKGTHEGDLYQI